MSTNLKRLLEHALAEKGNLSFDLTNFLAVNAKRITPETQYFSVNNMEFLDNTSTFFFQWNDKKKVYVLGKIYKKPHYGLYEVTSMSQLQNGKLYYVISPVSVIWSEYPEKYKKSLQENYPSGKIIGIKGVNTIESYRNEGYATLLYTLLLYHFDAVLFGDSIQYEPERKIWSKISQIPNITIDIFGYANTNGKGNLDIILKGVVIDDINDHRIWEKVDDYYKDILPSMGSRDSQVLQRFRVASYVRVVATLNKSVLPRGVTALSLDEVKSIMG